MNTEQKLKVIRRWCRNFIVESTSADEYYAKVIVKKSMYSVGIYSFHTDTFPLHSELIDNAYLVIRERVWYFIHNHNWSMQ